MPAGDNGVPSRVVKCGPSGFLLGQHGFISGAVEEEAEGKAFGEDVDVVLGGRDGVTKCSLERHAQLKTQGSFRLFECSGIIRPSSYGMKEFE